MITIIPKNIQRPYNFELLPLLSFRSLFFYSEWLAGCLEEGAKPLASSSLISFLKSCRKRGLAMLFRRLLFAYWRLAALLVLIWPTPCSSPVMKEMVAMTMVRTFQLEVQVSLWKLVKVVQMGFSTSNLPLGVKNISFGGAKGYSSLSYSTPWQKPPSYAPSSPWMQKWKLSTPSRAIQAWFNGSSRNRLASFSRRRSTNFLPPDITIFFRLDQAAYHNFRNMASLFFTKERNEFEELTRRTREAAQSERHAFGRRAVEMLRCMFPPQGSDLKVLYKGAVEASSTSWVKKVKQIIENFQPGGKFGEALIVNRDERVDFKSLSFGPEYEAYFSTKEAMSLLGIKKEINLLTLPIFQCFFMKLLYELFCFKQYERKVSGWQELFKIDDFHYFIIRNPILHIVREWLIETRTRPAIFKRIVDILELLILRQPIFRFRKGDSLELKSYHFYGIYLLIQWKTSNIIWDFLSFVVDYLEVKQKNFNVLFCCWLRLHLILLNRGSEYELGTRKEIEIGLQKMEVWKVRVHSLEDFKEQMADITDHDYLDHLFIQIDSLLSKELWAPSAQFLTAILTLVLLFEIARKDVVKFQSALIAEIGKIILKIEFAIKKKDEPFIKDVIREIKDRYLGIGGQFEGVESSHDNEEYIRRGSLFSELRSEGSQSKSRKSFINYQRDLSPWQEPLKSGESHLFYMLGFKAATFIDKCRGKFSNDGYPTTNLRFMASFNFIATLIAIAILISFLF